MDRSNNSLLLWGQHLGSSVPDCVTDVACSFQEITLHCRREKILDLVVFLKEHSDCLFSCLIDITAVDYPERDERFDVVYHFLSPSLARRIRVICSVGEGCSLASLSSLFPAANWYEREVYDMFGVLFSGHPDLRRILTDYGFDGYPLRKDFPMTGYVEVRWSEEERRVVYEPVRLTQEFRSFDFLSPWEGDHAHVLPGDERIAKNG